MSSNETKPAKLRWTLRTLLMLFIPLSVGLAYYSHVHHEQQRAIEAYQRMDSKGVTAHLRNGLQHANLVFTYANVTDEDLAAFIPAFNGHAPSGFGRIEAIRLNGSKVSTEAVERFRQAVPDCRVEL